MAPKKRLGIGAECTVPLRFLHPKDKVTQKISNQTSSQKLSGLIAQGLEKKAIRQEPKSCVVFRHEDFGAQPLWCMPRYACVDTEGPEASFFDQDVAQPRRAVRRPNRILTAAAAEGGENGHGASGDEQEQSNIRDNNNAVAVDENGNEALPEAIASIIDNLYLDDDDIAAAIVAAGTMVDVDDDNMPAPENVPEPAAAPTNDIMIGWQHSGICYRKSAVAINAKPTLLCIPREDEPTNLQLFEALFFKAYIEGVILPKTNEQMMHGKPLTYGEFLRWLGLWILMATIVGPRRSDFWSTSKINPFEGAPFRLTVWMKLNRFNEILRALQFTDADQPPFTDKFWEVRQMIQAWGENMMEQFSPGFANCLDESMSVWSNQYTCPGFMFVPRKPHPFGNKYHSVCCCQSGIMWGIELVEGKDRPSELGQAEYNNLGSTIGLLLRILTPIFSKGLMVILDGGFCVLQGIIELRKKGVFASALIKKHMYWPKYIRGDEISEHFATKEIGATDSWEGKLSDVGFHIYAMKEPDYVMSLMSTYGTNERVGKLTRRDWEEDGVKKTTTFKYPEVIDNHFKYRHSVDDHNAKRHSPISLEVTWATKRWPNRVFAFLLSITEVNCWLAEKQFTTRESASMLDYRKKLALSLIENDYIYQEEARGSAVLRQSKRSQEERGHGLLSLPHNKKFKQGQMVSAKSRYPQHKCSRCPREIRTYCKCSPGVYLCGECFSDHVLDCIPSP